MISAYAYIHILLLARELDFRTNKVDGYALEVVGSSRQRDDVI